MEKIPAARNTRKTRLTEEEMERVQEMIEDKELSLRETARQIGFSSHWQLTRALKARALRIGQQIKPL